MLNRPPTKTAQDILRDASTAYTKRLKLHALVIGEKGAGKTTLATTAPTPVAIFEFDPGGASLPAVRRLVDGGNAIVFPFDEPDGSDTPKEKLQYKRFVDNFNILHAAGFFDTVATVVLDSMTTFSEALIHYITRSSGHELLLPGCNPKNSGMEIRDWGIFANTLAYLINRLANISCHTVVLGHINRDKDEVFGGILRSLMVAGKSSHRLPVSFGEYYCMRAKTTARGLERYLLTAPEESIPASSRLSAEGVLDPHEKPDLSHILTKCGIPLGTKPPLVTSAPAPAPATTTSPKERTTS